MNGISIRVGFPERNYEKRAKSCIRKKYFVNNHNIFFNLKLVFVLQYFSSILKLSYCTPPEYLKPIQRYVVVITFI